MGFMFTACSSQQVSKIDESEQISTPLPMINNEPTLPYEQLELPGDFQEKA